MIYSLKIIVTVLVSFVVLTVIIFASVRYGNVLPVMKVSETHCQNVLIDMTTGNWKSNSMTTENKTYMRKFLEDSRKMFDLPVSLQRTDKLCGNVTFGPRASIWFRALCDPYGETPCCYNNICSAKPENECHCDECYDLRQDIHAEFSQWVPFNQRCQVKVFTPLETCELLKGLTIFISGDSYMRHLFTAFLLLLRNNTVDGAMMKDVSKGIRSKCYGLYMFTEKQCRLQLDHQPHGLCDNKMNLIFKEYYRADFGKQFYEAVNNITKVNKTIIICGIGLHSQLNANTVMKNYVLPSLNIVKNSSRSKFVFVTPHYPGILKNTRTSQTKQRIVKFTSLMEKELKPYGVPIFNTYSMTKGIVSFDGNHYGLGINMLKVQVLLNYIAELKNKEKW